MIRRHPDSRRGVAAVELALITSGVLVPLMWGVWEVARYIQVKQVVSNSAREGARLAAQAYTINTSGTPVRVYTYTNYPNVHDTVYQYLISCGFSQLQKSDVTVQFKFTSGDTSLSDPYLGEKGQQFTVSVTIPWSKVRRVNQGLFNPTEVSFTVSWQMLRDDEFTINDTLPTW
jgi:Flp pilus assembly protein TadG